MALTHTYAGGASAPSSNFFGSSLAVSLTSVPLNAVVWVACVADNNGTNGASSTSTPPTDTLGWTYTRRINQNNDPGAANEGTTLTVWTATATSSGNNTITVAFSPNTTCRVVDAGYVTSDAGTVSYTSASANGGNGTTPTITTASMAATDLVVGFLGVERSGTITADADTTRGTWSTGRTGVANGGSEATSQRYWSQAKAVSSAGTQTFNPTYGITAYDYNIGYLTFSEQLVFTGTVAVTQAGDTPDASGTLTFTGTIAVTQADDSATASGNVTVNDVSQSGVVAAIALTGIGGQPIAEASTAASTAQLAVSAVPGTTLQGDSSVTASSGFLPLVAQPGTTTQGDAAQTNQTSHLLLEAHQNTVDVGSVAQSNNSAQLNLLAIQGTVTVQADTGGTPEDLVLEGITGSILVGAAAQTAAPAALTFEAVQGLPVSGSSPQAVLAHPAHLSLSGGTTQAVPGGINTSGMPATLLLAGIVNSKFTTITVSAIAGSLSLSPISNSIGIGQATRASTPATLILSGRFGTTTNAKTQQNAHGTLVLTAKANTTSAGLATAVSTPGIVAMSAIAGTSTMEDVSYAGWGLEIV